jgi:hypothetical protein
VAFAEIELRHSGGSKAASTVAASRVKPRGGCLGRAAAWYDGSMRRPGWRAPPFALAAAAILGLLAASALGATEAEQARARAAYDAAIEAAGRHDYARAAELFAEADSIVPNDVALRSALDAAVLADDPVLGMRLVERADARPGSSALDAAARKAEEKLGERTGRLLVQCPAASCSATIDGSPATIGKPTVVALGGHTVIIEQGSAVSRQRVEVASGATLAVAPRTATELRGGGAEQSDGGAQGWSPAWFWAGLGATAVLGGVTIWSGVDTLARHADYLETGQGADAGRTAQTRTNVLLFTTIGLGLVTSAIGIFAVGWSSNEDTAVSVAPAPGGLGLSGRF